MKRIAWLTVLLTLALLLTACATPADPEQPDTTDPTTTTTTSAVAGDSTTDTTAEGGSTTEGEAPATTDGEEPAEPTAAPTTEQGKSTTSKTEGTKPTTKPTTTEPTGNKIDWDTLFGDTTTKKDGTTTTTTTKKTTTAPTKTTQKPQVVDKVTLPAVGTDVDGRGRIYLSAASLKNGVVTLTLHNYTDEQGSKWQTEETNYVTYACYDAAGNRLTGKGDNFGTFYIGALQAGEEVSTTFPLPEGTVKVELTGSKIVYWTPWS